MKKELARLMIAEVEYYGIEERISSYLLRDDFKEEFLTLSEETNSQEFWWMMAGISEVIRDIQ